MNKRQRVITVGTRQSALALTQTNPVVADLKVISERLHFPFQFQIKKIVTKGDQLLDLSLAKQGGKGLFVKEIEQQLLDGEIDLAVHSMKDMPAELPTGLVIGAVPKREDARDVLISRSGAGFNDLPKGAIVGTSSLRRSAQLLAIRPDLQIIAIRGNIDSRLRKLEEQQMDAIILAAAGLHRVGWQQSISEYLPTDRCLPAVAQGALALECRGSDDSLLELLQHYEHPLSRRLVDAERKFLATLGGSCQLPVAGYAQSVSDLSDDELVLSALVAHPNGAQVFRYQETGTSPLHLGENVARALLNSGADAILQFLTD